ncbi:MAG: hypothetical protein HY296_01300 [Thaumarchaeota archaeon]|nr:hypothetical protein [Nitrososphaerota archaeon]
MSAAIESPRRGRLLKIAALGIVIAIEIGAFVYLYPSLGKAPPAVTFTFPHSTTTSHTGAATTSTKSASNSVVVKAAIIRENSLAMDVMNTGKVWTKRLMVTGLCTSDFKDCYSYEFSAGKPLNLTFALGPSMEYVFSIPKVCVVPILSCHEYHPVINNSYYFAITVVYTSGPPSIIPVKAKAVNTYPHTAALQAMTAQIQTFSKNGSGRLTVNIGLRTSVTSASFVVRLLSQSGSSGFTIRLPYEVISCGGSSSVSCSSGALTLVQTFSTVVRGVGTPVYPPPYLLTVRDMTQTGKVYFAIWISSVAKA